MKFTQQDAACMRRALALARRGQGYVEPNPMVGAVVVRPDRGGGNGRVVGEGYHHRFGEPHAEVMALAAAGRRARGATLYVTLEPCCHWGKTPPCTDAVLAAGVSRVVVAMVDPFAQVSGSGIALLRRKGVRVDVGLLKDEAAELNAAFLTRVNGNGGGGAAFCDCQVGAEPGWRHCHGRGRIEVDQFGGIAAAGTEPARADGRHSGGTGHGPGG